MLRGGRVPWWPAVEISDAPAETSVGGTFALSVRSPLGYRLRTHLTLTEVAPVRSLAASSVGDLRGHGRIELERAAGGTIVTTRWDVVTARAWMNATAFLLRPLFAAAHARVMRAGERGLRAVVATRD